MGVCFLRICPPVFLETRSHAGGNKASCLSYCLLPPHSWAVINKRERKIPCLFGHYPPDSSESGPKGQSQRLLRLLLCCVVSRTFSVISRQSVAEVESWTSKGWRSVIFGSRLRVGSEPAFWYGPHLHVPSHSSGPNLAVHVIRINVTHISQPSDCKQTEPPRLWKQYWNRS